MINNVRVYSTNKDWEEVLPGLHIGIADGMSIARVWACRYSK